ncbi:gp16 family protein [Methylomonas sp. ZR1]|uniref:gp16 family protein n=1 Tax=Methylomonas sp. ZR1 TaxID=1797072 RepID=UPI0014928A38|nr:regulatory protein GemA [Methylomonas sp. ZR1]NOV29195.1 regulatory protein GemA [Methylomonas sp. ZR1]
MSNQPHTHTNPKHKAQRYAALGKIHLGKKQLGMDDETYRAMLLTIGGVKSSKDLTNEGLNKVLRHLEKAGVVFVSKKKHGRKPNNLPSGSDRNAKLSKIEALLAEAKRPWEYAHAMAKRMYKKDALEFCDHDELSGIIAALVKNAKREGRKTDATE